MGRPYVTKVAFRKGQIVLTLAVDDFLADDSIEISGFATQNSGGLATFYDIQPIIENPDGTRVVYTKATPAQEFHNGEDITVSLRAARVWTTVITGSEVGGISSEKSGGDTPGTPYQDGTILDNVRTVAWAAVSGPSPSSSASQASAGGGPYFRNA
jgi:hypothetical protein